MTTKVKLNHIFKLLFLGIFIVSCETEDINPTISLSSDVATLSEANGTLTVTVTINTQANGNINVPLIFSGSATENSDYSTSSNTLTIPSGATSGSITFNGLQDTDIEGIENIIVSIANTSDYITLDTTSITIEVLDDDVDTDGDGVLDADDDCPNDFGEVANNGCPFLGFLINEVHYDPASGSAGDANGDGTRSPLQDEFIEFFNSGPQIDLSGYTISDASQVRHIFPAGSIVPVNGVIVVFGGGTPTGSFGGAIIQTASNGQLNMSNAGDLVTLADASGNTVLTFDISPLSGNPNESYTRNPDLTGSFEQHAGITEANGALFSPGTKLDGTNF